MEQSELEEIMRLVDLSIVVCVYVCLCTRIGGDMHSNERLLNQQQTPEENSLHCSDSPERCERIIENDRNLRKYRKNKRGNIFIKHGAVVSHMSSSCMALINHWQLP